MSGLSRCVVCLGGWSVEMCGLSMWVVCRGGKSAKVGGLSPEHEPHYKVNTLRATSVGLLGLLA